jgi:hypothetical protein
MTQRFRRRATVLLGAGILVCATAAMVSACSDTNANQPVAKDCTLDTGASTIAGSLTVTYQVTVPDGTGTVSSLTYTADTGPVTVTNPTLPFQENLTLLTAPAQLQVVGTVSNGTMVAQFSAVGSPNRSEQKQVSCTTLSD